MQVHINSKKKLIVQIAKVWALQCVEWSSECFCDLKRKAVPVCVFGDADHICINLPVADAMSSSLSSQSHSESLDKVSYTYSLRGVCVCACTHTFHSCVCVCVNVCVYA